MKLHSPQRQRGMTLVELLVAMAIGLVVTLAVTSIVIVGESNKRTTASTNDTNQGGAFAAYVIDRAMRSAGSGFAQSWNLGMFGCRLSGSRKISGTDTAILPRAAAFPAPFAGVLAGLTNTLRMAPVLIANNVSSSGSDVLVVMGGNAATGDVPRPILGLVGGTGLRLRGSTVGATNGDIGVVTQNGAPDCLIEQVDIPASTLAKQAALTRGFDSAAAVVVDTLPLGGDYFIASGPTTALATFAGSNAAYFTTLGNVNASNLQFTLIGVGDNNTLFSYDLLRATATTADPDPVQAVADSVSELHAMYGVDTDNDGIVDTWIDPGAAGYDMASLMARPPSLTVTAPYTIRQILAIRVALVMRSPTYEKEVVSTVRPKLFAGTPGEIAQVNLTGELTHYRYRVIDTTIPLRNMLMLPSS